MTNIDILIASLVGLAIALHLFGPKPEAAQKEQLTIDTKDTQLATELKPVPAVNVGPEPTSTAFTPGQATSYWNKELDNEAPNPPTSGAV